MTVVFLVNLQGDSGEPGPAGKPGIMGKAVSTFYSRCLFDENAEEVPDFF